MDFYNNFRAEALMKVAARECWRYTVEVTALIRNVEAGSKGSKYRDVNRFCRLNLIRIKSITS